MSYYNQSIIVNKLKKLGYSEENLDGHCYGFSNMARNAFLDGNIAQFHHDINILFKLTNTDIEAIRTSPIASSIELEAGETVEILDILAFCDGITLFQRPYDYIELLSEDPNQYINQIGNAAEGMLTPMTLEQDDTSPELAQRMHGCYTADDLVGVFSALQQNVTEPFSIISLSMGHAISIHFDPENKQWTVIDPEHFPFDIYNDNNLGDLAKEIIFAQNMRSRSNGFASISMDFFVQSQNKLKFNEDFANASQDLDFQQATQLNEDTLSRSDTNGINALHIAARTNGPKSIKKLIDAGADVNSVSGQGSTALIYASSNLSQESCGMFLDAGAEVNFIDYFGFSALYNAAAQNDLSLVTFLLEKGADPNLGKGRIENPLNQEARYKNKDSVIEISCLHQAIRLGNQEMVSALLQKGANIDLTALTWAQENQDETIISQLVDADINTVFTLVIMTGNVDLAMTLNEKGAELAKDDQHDTIQLLFDALSKGYPPAITIKILIRVEGLSSDQAKSLQQGGQSFFTPERANSLVNQAGETWLHHAVRNNNEQATQELIAVMDNLDQADSNGNTALHIAVDQQNITLAEALLNAGADPNLLDKNGFPPLINAIEDGNIELVKLLLQHGAKIDVNSYRDEKPTPFEYALTLTNQPILELLIDSDKNTALTLALKKRAWPLLHSLIQSGAEFDPKKIPDLISILADAIDVDIDLSTLNTLLVQIDNIDALIINQKSLITLAVEKENAVMVEALIEHGVNVNQKNLRGETLLQLAIESGNVSIMSQLLAAGADIHAQLNMMNTPLQAAMRNPEPDALEFIVTHHSNLMTESDLNTIAHRAAQKGWCNVITSLSHQGFNTNLPVYHQSLLSIAVEARQPKMVETLINLGANPNEKFLKQRAKDLNDEATQKILKEARAGLKKVCKAAKNGDVSAIDSILGITSCINRLNDDGKSPLHIAAKKDHVEFAQALLDKGADINFVDKKQRSALYHAVNKGNIEMIRWLLDNGADINLADKKGISPADLAQQSNDIKIQVLFSSAVDDLIEVIDTNQVSANTDNWHKPAANPDNQRTMKDKLRELRTHDKSDDDAENAMGMQSRR